MKINKKKWISKVLGYIIFLILFFTYAFYCKGKLLDKYNMAIDKMNNQEYEEAIELFKELGTGYQDSSDYIDEAKYLMALEFYEEKDYYSALKLFFELDEYKDSQYYILEIVDMID